MASASPASGADRSPFDVGKLQGRINDVLDLEPAVWGVLVYSTGLGRDIASVNPDTALCPASNVKLFTALASLVVSHVGENHRFRTHAHVIDVPREDKAMEDKETPNRRAICIHPCGDPSFTTSDLERLLTKALEASNVSADDVDASRTQLGGTPWREEGVPGTWEVGGVGHDWAAPPSRAVLDGNLTSLMGVLRNPDEKFSQSPRVRFRDACRAVIRDKQTRDASPSLHHGAEVIEMSCGCIPPPGGRFSNIRSGIHGLEIESGEVKKQRNPNKWAVHDSQPVCHFVQKTVRDSENLTSEQLLRTCASGKDSGRWLTGWSSVFCRDKCVVTGGTSRGVDSDLEIKTSAAPKRVRFVDGSGLSRHNVAPPRAFVAMVLSAVEGAALEAEEAGSDVTNTGPFALGEKRKPFTTFLESLPEIEGRLLSADDDASMDEQSTEKKQKLAGTLDNRLNDLHGSIRAKTGSMSGVESLSGYFSKHATKELGTIAFSIIGNNHASNVADARFRLHDVVDSIVRLIDRLVVED